MFADSELLLQFSEIIRNNGWMAPVVAVLAGIVTSLAPCCLSSITLVMGYVGGAELDGRHAFRLSLTFAAGSAITFTVLGTAASLMGHFLNGTAKWWFLILGVLLVAMALQVWGIVNLIPSSLLLSKCTRKSYIGALIAGILCGCFSTPCATPVLVTLLALVAGKGNVAWGVTLLLLYSIGHGILTVVAGTSTGLVQKLSVSRGYNRFSKLLRGAMGTVILCMAFYMFYRGF